MKKVGQIIRNLYRITLLKPTGKKSDRIIDIHGQQRNGADMDEDSILRNAVQNDFVDLQPDPQMLQFLATRVEARKKAVKENSFFFIPAFLFKSLELRMAVITLTIVIALGVNPAAQYETNRKISPFSLADTLIDSSKLDKPFLEQHR